MARPLLCISAVDGSIYAERLPASHAEIELALTAAQSSQPTWAATSLSNRQAACLSLVDHLVARRQELAEQLAWQMGRPIQYAGGEIDGFAERARSMIEQSTTALADSCPPSKAGFKRFIRRTPLGTVLVVAPWNYPFLTAVNSIIPALLVGNAVLLKSSKQTPLSAEAIIAAGTAAGLPSGLLQCLHLDHQSCNQLIGNPQIYGVAFTGSTEGGRNVEQAAAGRFIPLGLELGGKDAAYVRADADLSTAIENLVDGAYFNSGQSCCGIERIYVHQSLFDDFIDGFAEQTRKYQLGDPLDQATTLGPMVSATAADFVRQQIAEAVADGATRLIQAGDFPIDQPGQPYLAPQALINVNHRMRVMTEESFGPVVGIMPVANDAEALMLMNDNSLGLTASIWTTDTDAAIALGDQLDVGTVFMNRCDYLDPELAWTGVGESGRGVSLSPQGFAQLSQVKSFHLRTGT